MRDIFDLPYLTDGIAGSGGVVKQSPEDFLVEERPLYEPKGSGEHLFLWIEKRGISTFDVIRHLASACGVSPRSVGYAGLKDVKAVARQYLCVSGVSEEKLRGINFESFRILDMKRNNTKLRVGHLAGNYFRIGVHGVDAVGFERARQVLDVLAAKGVPNFYGPQRFGAAGRNVLVGRALLRERYVRAIQAFFAPCRPEEGTGVYEARKYAFAGDYNRSLKLFPDSFVPERRLAIALRDAGLNVKGLSATKAQLARVLWAIPKRYLEFYVSALQAYLFDEVLKERYRSLDQVLVGDFAWIHSKGCVFLVEDAAAESPRAASLEISPSGPIFGYKVPYAKGDPGEIEWRILKSARLLPRHFRMRLGLKNKGVRRPMRVPITEVTLEPSADGFTIGFALPKGSYATTVLREIMKPSSWDVLV
jgi:tRNA pseudouridine13 synthase